MKNIYIGSDHAGFSLKQKITEYLKERDYSFEDLGPTELDETDDYPDIAEKVAKIVQEDENGCGILLCGSGQGVCITANKFGGIRAAIGFSVGATQLSRSDDDANILCIPARLINPEETLKIVDVFLTTYFSQAERHQRRLQKISNIEKNERIL